jgi:hypothetical protein
MIIEAMHGQTVGIHLLYAKATQVIFELCDMTRHSSLVIRLVNGLHHVT